MKPFSHMAIPLVFAFLALSASLNVALKHVGEGLELENTGAKVINNPPPPAPGTHKTSASAVLKANSDCIRTFTNVMKLMAKVQQQPPGTEDASTIKKATIVACGYFSKLIEQLLWFQESMANNSNADKSQEEKIKKASKEAAALFANILGELIAPFSKGSGSDAVDKAWANAIIETADTEAIAVINLYDQLSNMPHPSTEIYKERASEAMRTTNVIVGVFIILIDELVLSQSTGLSKAHAADNACPSDDACSLLDATYKYDESLTNLVKLIVQDHKKVKEVTVKEVHSEHHH